MGSNKIKLDWQFYFKGQWAINIVAKTCKKKGLEPEKYIEKLAIVTQNYSILAEYLWGLAQRIIFFQARLLIKVYNAPRTQSQKTIKRNEYSKIR